MLFQLSYFPLAEFADFVGPAIVIWLVVMLVVMLTVGWKRKLETKPVPASQSFAGDEPVAAGWLRLDECTITFDDLQVSLSVEVDDLEKRVRISPPIFGLSEISLGTEFPLKAYVLPDKYLLATQSRFDAIVFSLRTGRQLRLKLGSGFEFDELSFDQTSIYFDYSAGCGRVEYRAEITLDPVQEFIAASDLENHRNTGAVTCT